MTLFRFLKREKEYVSCEWLENGIHFTSTGLYHCDKYAHPGGNNDAVAELDIHHKYNFTEFFRKKKQQKKQVKKGIIPPGCSGCYLLKKKKWINSEKITHMALSSNTKCNSDCIYCFTHKNKAYYNRCPDIPIFDFIKKSINKGIILPDCEVQIGGGEPVLNKEFEDILNLFADNQFNNIRIYSSGIKYSKSIERFLNSDLLKELVISPDSGNRELYKKIKNTDKFDEVWENITNYCKAQKENKLQLRIKYIIIPGINDNLEAILEFFYKIEESRVQYVLIDIEMEWYKLHKQDKEQIQNLLKLIKFMEKYCNNLKIEYGHYPSVCYLVEDNHKMYDDTVI